MKSFTWLVCALALTSLACGGDASKGGEAVHPQAILEAARDAQSTQSGPTRQPTESESTGDESAWCESQLALTEVDDDDLTPEEWESAFEEDAVLIEEAEDLAPDEISDQVAISAEVFYAMWAAMADAEYDFSEVDLSEIRAFESSEVSAANDELRAYNAEVCGIEEEAAPEPQGESEPSGSTYDDLNPEVQSNVAFVCAMAKNGGGTILDLESGTEIEPEGGMDAAIARVMQSGGAGPVLEAFGDPLAQAVDDGIGVDEVVAQINDACRDLGWPGA